MKYSVENVIDFINHIGVKNKLDGKGELVFDSFCPLNSLKSNSITWARKVENVEVSVLESYQNLVLVLELGQEIEEEHSFPIVYVENVHRTFFKLIAHLFAEQDREITLHGIEKTAVIESENVGKNVYIGHHSYIGKDVIVGDNVKIYNNVTIQGRCSIGDYTVIESGTTIGACGFGHYTDIDGNPVCVPHLGGVVIGKHVKLGANSAISRGCLGDTVIEDYVKTDNLCHIAHNDHIKKRAMLTACTEISGSVTVGEDVWLGPGTLVNDGITIGDYAFTGTGSVVVKNIPSGKVVAGVPAKVLRDRKGND